MDVDAPQSILILNSNKLSGSNENQSHGDDLGHAINRYFDSRGYESNPENPLDADLILVINRPDDEPVTIEELNVFRFPATTKGRLKKVILIDRTWKSQLKLNEQTDEWLFVVSDVVLEVKKLENFLELEKTQSDPPKTTLDIPDISVWQNLLCGSFKSSQSTEKGTKILEGMREERNKDKRPSLSKSGLHLLTGKGKEGTLSHFWYGVLRLSSGYSKFEHLLNQETAHLLNIKEPEKLVENVKKKSLLDRSIDLRRSLPYAFELSKNTDVSPKKILLIDDNPQQIAKELLEINELLLPGYTIKVWNPNKNKHNGETLDLITGYNSLNNTDIITGNLKSKKKLSLGIDIFPLEKYASSEADSEMTLLKDVIEDSQFILVDILFQVSTRETKEKGYKIIRGLHRLIKDLETEFHRSKALSGAASWAQKEIIAISRADDVDKIHEAFRAGATGYLLKSRLLSLPCVIGRLHTPTSIPVKSYHRNFSQLKNLPPETVRLLRSVFIPPGKSYHQNKTDQQNGSELSDSQKVMDILRQVPKTDLHVHVGSCMSPEFLVVASLVMLFRITSGENGREDRLDNLTNTISKLIGFWSGGKAFSFRDGILPCEACAKEKRRLKQEKCSRKIKFSENEGGLKSFHKNVVECLSAALSIEDNSAKNETATFRSVLHQSLKIPDYWDKMKASQRLKGIAPANIMQFALSHGKIHGREIKKIHKDDILRVYLLFLAAKNKNAEVSWEPTEGNKLKVKENNILNWFRVENNRIKKGDWKKLHDHFYDSKKKTVKKNPELRVNVTITNSESTKKRQNNFLEGIAGFDEMPIANTVATGVGANNLVEYLHGCEFSGAEFLHHPYLMKLYAQQTVHNFVRQGILYSELRVAVSGYVNQEVGFGLQEAIETFIEAFDEAQETVWQVYNKKSSDPPNNSDSFIEKNWLWGSKVDKASEKDKLSPFCIHSLFNENERAKKDHQDIRFPSKVGLIFTGKRHKPTWQMIREAAAAVLLYSAPPQVETAAQFADKMMKACRPVGFDLAGPEEEYAPSQFRSEFDRIGKLHIPITAHAGENATVQFVESTMLDLGASRIGHGLALVDDAQLMNRAREDNVCIELCPVSNYQTNKFRNENGHGRSYPLKKLLDNGNPICINTDNPIISDTNIIKEYFQASYAYWCESEQGLSLWEALRIIHMGFVHSFLSLPERKAILEIADQLIFDLFTEEETVRSLRELASSRE